MDQKTVAVGPSSVEGGSDAQQKTNSKLEQAMILQGMFDTLQTSQSYESS